MDINNIKLVTYPHSSLSTMSKDVENINSEIIELSNKMIMIMLSNNGIGLAANQVGINLNIIAVHIDGTEWLRKILINPKIINTDKNMQTIKEGCLSLPGIYYDIARPKEIEIEYIDVSGNKQNSIVSGLVSTCIQHEIDHLNGVMFPERLSQFKRDRLFEKYKKIIKSLK